MTRRSRFQPTAFALSALVAASFAAGLPATASAQGCSGAPGASAIQQYCEAVPSADGGSDRPSNGGSDDSGADNSGRGSSNSGGGSANTSNGSGASDPTSGVSSETSRALNEAGSDGASIERLAGGENKEKTSSKKGSEQSSSQDVTSDSTGSGDDGAVLADRVEGPSDPDGSPLKAATNAVASGPTAGGGLVWSLAGLSLAGVAAAVLFRRRGGDLAEPEDES